MTMRLDDYMTSAPPADEKKIQLEFRQGINGLHSVVLHGPRRSSAEVLLYGAQIISWKNHHGEELLFVSSKADFSTPTPIFGGIPICFPKKTDPGSLDEDEFARYRYWNIDCSPPPLHSTSLSDIFVDLILTPNDADMQIWPHSFEYRLRITMGTLGELMLTSRIRNTNTNGNPFSFSFAYRNYLQVSNVRHVLIKGLETLDYLDNLKDMKRFTHRGDAVTLKSKVDKAFLDAPTQTAVIDSKKKQTFFIRKDGLRAVGVWNLGKKEAKEIDELGRMEYWKMVCVEPCAANETITLRGGEEWRGHQELRFDPSIYNSRN